MYALAAGRSRDPYEADSGPDDEAPLPLADASNRRMVAARAPLKVSGSFSIEANSDRFRRCMSVIVDLFKSERKDNLPIGAVMRELNEKLARLQSIGEAGSEDAYSRAEVDAIVNALQNDNKVMYSEGIIYEI